MGIFMNRKASIKKSDFNAYFELSTAGEVCLPMQKQPMSKNVLSLGVNFAFPVRQGILYLYGILCV